MLATVWHNKTNLIHINHEFSVSTGFYSERAKAHYHRSLPNETEHDSGNYVGCITKWLLPVYAVKLVKIRQTSSTRRWPIPPDGPYLPGLPYLYFPIVCIFKNKRVTMIPANRFQTGMPFVVVYAAPPFSHNLRKTGRCANSQQPNCRVNPSPPGLLAHPWVPGGGGGSRPPLSREPLVVERRARWHSKALDKTLQNRLSELKIEVKCEVKVRSKVKIWRFDGLGPGDQYYRTWWLKLRQNVVKGMVKVWYEYKWHTNKTSRSRSGHKRSLYLRIVIKSRDTWGIPGQIDQRKTPSCFKKSETWSIG